MWIKSRILDLRQNVDRADLFGIVIVAMAAWIGTIAASAQIAEYRWEQKAVAEFYARMPTPIIVPQLFNFAGRERLIDIVIFAVCSLAAWVALVRWVCSKLYRSEIRRRIYLGATVLQSSIQFPEFCETLDTRLGPDRNSEVEGYTDLASEHQADKDVNFQGFEYVEFEYAEPERLRASAEASFRLAQGAVSPRLAQELEDLGQALQREAEVAEERMTGS